MQSEEDQVNTYQKYGFVKIPDNKRKKNLMFYDLSWYSENEESVADN
jgi:hypothetical protein